MLRSLLIGLSAGSRALTPLATVSEVARGGGLSEANPAVRLLAHPLFSAGSKALAKVLEQAEVVDAAHALREAGPDIVLAAGGAIQGHPLGATGARLVGKASTLLKRDGGRYGLATQCIGKYAKISYTECFKQKAKSFQVIQQIIRPNTQSCNSDGGVNIVPGVCCANRRF